jgi:hypothetical protein
VTLFPHSGARPSFPFKYGNRTNAKEPWGPQPSTLYLASDRLRPESWPRKKKLEQFSSVRLELKSPNLLITKAFQFFSSNKKLFLSFYDLATLADPFSRLSDGSHRLASHFSRLVNFFNPLNLN